MTRPLLITAALGFLVSIVCFTVVVASGGFAWRNLAWTGWDAFDPDGGPPAFGGGEPISRTLTWPGGDALTVNVPAQLTYTQGPEARLTVTGPRGAVERLTIEDGVLRFDHRLRRPGLLTVAMTAPGVRTFRLNGSQTLRIDGYDQDQLDIRVAGSGDVIAHGKARSVELTIAGSGKADLGGIDAEEAEVHIAGAGDTTLAPRERAEIHIAGSGDVTLTTEPPDIETHIAGSGRIIHRPPAPVAPAAPPASPAPAKTLS